MRAWIANQQEKQREKNGKKVRKLQGLEDRCKWRERRRNAGGQSTKLFSAACFAFQHLQTQKTSLKLWNSMWSFLISLYIYINVYLNILCNISDSFQCHLQFILFYLMSVTFHFMYRVRSCGHSPMTHLEQSVKHKTHAFIKLRMRIQKQPKCPVSRENRACDNRNESQLSGGGGKKRLVGDDPETNEFRENQTEERCLKTAKWR